MLPSKMKAFKNQLETEFIQNASCVASLSHDVAQTDVASSSFHIGGRCFDVSVKI